jgi:hypothetical protein
MPGKGIPKVVYGTGPYEPPHFRPLNQIAIPDAQIKYFLYKDEDLSA